MTAPLRQSVALHAALNAIFALRLADGTAAREWLTVGGWAQLDGWIASHRGDPSEITTTTEGTSP